MPPFRPPTRALHASTTSSIPKSARLPPRLTCQKSRTLASSSTTPASSESAQHGEASTHEDSHGGPHGHESHYDPPGGWLFGVKPGEKYQKEGWENAFVYGFWGSLLVTAVAYAYKPDTS
ncbi:MAG: hypothetical protein OHK93_001800 [Ramalina farinacea]|uniref:NADH dehydrogenase [ubiquinone] 1 beta subcomplex subunit 11, mitochondrial n=1 Tax=Ramalina farinacea TaxID=258253 RepID=A0AA43QQ45_9LECA|nr:hypothetical protein [Ramalina farinacea]